MKLIIDIPEKTVKAIKEKLSKETVLNNVPLYAIANGIPFDSVIEDIKAEIHATAEMYEDGDCYLSVEWIDDIIDKHISGKEK